MAVACVSASGGYIVAVLLVLLTSEIRSAQRFEPVTTQLQSHSNVKDSDQAAGNAVLYQSSRVAATSRLDSGRGLLQRRGRRPLAGRRRVFVDSDSTGRRPGVRVGSYFESERRFAGEEDDRRLFSWNEAGRLVPLRRRVVGRARLRPCSSDSGCEGQLLPPSPPAAVRHQPGTTYDRRGINAAPRATFSTSSSSVSSSSSENQLSHQPGSTVITRYPHRTVYRNASGTYVRQTFGSSPAGFRYQSAAEPASGHDFSRVFNRTVVTQHRVVSHSRAGSDGTDSNFTRSFFTSDSSPSTFSSTVGGGVGVGALNQIAKNESQSSISVLSSSSSSFTNSSRHLKSTGALDRGSATTSGWSSGSSDQRELQYEEHSTAQLREAYIKRNRIQQFGECKCNMLGTDPEGGPCDPSTGQCPCLPHVMGLQCDRCEPHHWKIAVGSGCEPCRCDDVGSINQQCNEYDGQCQCRPGFGGRRCDQCEDLFWGDPRRQCRPCQCDTLGSAAPQCERDSGRCRCRQGVGGVRCDQCARGFQGQSPECRACGECFDNWDRVLVELRERTDYLVSEAGQIKQGGSSGAYRSEFDRTEQWLLNIQHVLGNATVSDRQIDELQTAIEDARRNVSAWEGWLRSVEGAVDNTTHRLLLAELQVPTLAARAQSVTAAAASLRENATQLQEANVDGALALTREAQRRSKAAEFSVLDTERTLAESERQRRRAENLLDRAGQQLNSSNTPAQRLIDRINSQLSNFERQMPDINNQVCDGSGDPCDALCGGAGCGKCGGLSCDEGAVTRATNALSVAKDAAKILTAREREVDELLRRVSGAKLSAENALQLALTTFGQAESSSNRTLAIQRRVEQLLVEIDRFLAADGASPQGIRDLSQQVLDMSISLRPEQITQLARQINETISSLTNIDAILLETADDLALAGQLKARADQAKLSAEAVLSTAETVMVSLDGAAAAQAEAEAALSSAARLADRAETELTQVDVDSSSLLHRSNVSLNRVLQLQSQHKQLLKEFSRNEFSVNKAVKEAGQAAALTVRAESGVEELETSYQQAAELLATRSAASSSARARAQQLLKKANQLASLTIAQLQELTKMSSEFSQQKELLVDLSEEVDSLNSRMTDYLQIITERVEFSRNCQAV